MPPLWLLFSACTVAFVAYLTGTHRTRVRLETLISLLFGVGCVYWAAINWDTPMPLRPNTHRLRLFFDTWNALFPARGVQALIALTGIASGFIPLMRVRRMAAQRR